MERELVFKDEGQEYAEALRFNNGRWEAMVIGTHRLLNCQIPGDLVGISPGDILLVKPRKDQADRADVILRYTEKEVRLLRTHRELPDDVVINIEDIARALGNYI